MLDFNEGMLIPIQQASLINNISLNDIRFMLSFSGEYPGIIPEYIRDEETNTIFFTFSEAQKIRDSYNSFVNWYEENYDEKGRRKAEMLSEEIDEEIDDLELTPTEIDDDTEENDQDSEDSPEELPEEPFALDEEDDENVKKKPRKKVRKKSSFQKSDEYLKEIERLKQENIRLENDYKELQNKQISEQKRIEENIRIENAIAQNNKEINRNRSDMYSSTYSNDYNTADIEFKDKMSADITQRVESAQKIVQEIQELKEQFQTNRNSYATENAPSLEYAKNIDIPAFTPLDNKYIEELEAIEQLVKDNQTTNITIEDLQKLNQSSTYKIDSDKHSGFDFSGHGEHYDKSEYAEAQAAIDTSIKDYNENAQISKSVNGEQDIKKYVDKNKNTVQTDKEQFLNDSGAAASNNSVQTESRKPEGADNSAFQFVYEPITAAPVSFASSDDYLSAQKNILKEIAEKSKALGNIYESIEAVTTTYEELNKQVSIRNDISADSNYFETNIQKVSLMFKEQSFQNRTEIFSWVSQAEDSLMCEDISMQLYKINQTAEERLKSNTSNDPEQYKYNVENIRRQNINDLLINYASQWNGEQRIASSDEYLNLAQDHFAGVRTIKYNLASLDNKEAIRIAQEEASKNGEVFSARPFVEDLNKKRAQIGSDYEKQIYGLHSTIISSSVIPIQNMQKFANSLLYTLPTDKAEFHNKSLATAAESMLAWQGKTSDAIALAYIKLSKETDTAMSAITKTLNEGHSTAQRQINKEIYSVVNAIIQNNINENLTATKVSNAMQTYQTRVDFIMAQNLSGVEKNKYLDAAKSETQTWLNSILSDGIDGRRKALIDLAEKSVDLGLLIKNVQSISGTDNKKDNLENVEVANKLAETQKRDLREFIDTQSNRDLQQIGLSVNQMLGNSERHNTFVELANGNAIIDLNDLKPSYASTAYQIHQARGIINKRVPTDAVRRVVSGFMYRKVKDLAQQTFAGTDGDVGFKTVTAVPSTVFYLAAAIGAKSLMKKMDNEMRTFSFNDFRRGQSAVMAYAKAQNGGDKLSLASKDEIKALKRDIFNTRLGKANVTSFLTKSLGLTGADLTDAKLAEIINNVSSKYTKAQQFAAQFLQRERQSQLLVDAISKFRGKSLVDIRNVSHKDIVAWLNTKVTKDGKLLNVESLSIEQLKDLLRHTNDEALKGGLAHMIQHKKNKNKREALAHTSRYIGRFLLNLRRKVFGDNDVDAGFETFLRLKQQISRGMRTSYKVIRTSGHLMAETIQRGNALKISRLQKKITNKQLPGKDIKKIDRKIAKLGKRQEKIITNRSKITKVRNKLNKFSPKNSRPAIALRNLRARAASFARNQLSQSAAGRTVLQAFQSMSSAFETIGNIVSKAWEILLWVILIIIALILILFAMSYYAEILLSFTSNSWLDSEEYSKSFVQTAYVYQVYNGERNSLESQWYNGLKGLDTNTTVSDVLGSSVTGFNNPADGTPFSINSFGGNGVTPKYITFLNGDGNHVVPSEGAGEGSGMMQRTNVRTIASMLEIKRLDAGAEEKENGDESEVDAAAYAIKDFVFGEVTDAAMYESNKKYIERVFDWTHFYVMSVGVKKTDDINKRQSDSEEHAVITHDSIQPGNLLTCPTVDCQSYNWSCVDNRCDDHNSGVIFATGETSTYREAGCVDRDEIKYYWCCICESKIPANQWANHLAGKYKATGQTEDHISLHMKYPSKGEIDNIAYTGINGTYHDCAGHPYIGDTDNLYKDLPLASGSQKHESYYMPNDSSLKQQSYYRIYKNDGLEVNPKHLENTVKINNIYKRNDGNYSITLSSGKTLTAFGIFGKDNNKATFWVFCGKAPSTADDVALFNSNVLVHKITTDYYIPCKNEPIFDINNALSISHEYGNYRLENDDFKYKSGMFLGKEVYSYTREISLVFWIPKNPCQSNNGAGCDYTSHTDIGINAVCPGHDSHYCGGHVQLYVDTFILYATDKVSDVTTKIDTSKDYYTLGSVMEKKKGDDNGLFKKNNLTYWPNIWSVVTQNVESRYAKKSVVVWDEWVENTKNKNSGTYPQAELAHSRTITLLQEPFGIVEPSRYGARVSWPTTPTTEVLSDEEKLRVQKAINGGTLHNADEFTKIGNVMVD